MSLQDQLINILIVSVPEEYFITMIILIMLGKYKFLSKEYWKENLIKIMSISVMPTAIFTNIVTYLGETLHIEGMDEVKSLIALIIIPLTIIGICGAKNIKDLLKIIIFSWLGFIFFIITELITVAIFTLGLKTPLTELNTSPYLNFVVVTPERLIQYGLLIYIFLKKNSLSQINLSKLIMNNKLLKIITVIFSFIDLFVLGLIVRYLFVLNIISELSKEAQVFIVVTSISLVIINILAILLPAICIYSNEKYLQKYGKDVTCFEK